MVETLTLNCCKSGRPGGKYRWGSFPGGDPGAAGGDRRLHTATPVAHGKRADGELVAAEAFALEVADF
jgi:hypothetical protein